MTKRASKRNSATDAFERLTATLIESIESEPGDWSKPWRDSVRGGLPANATTGKHYRGGNLWTLAMSRADSAGPSWATYKQWQSVGAQVQKGSRSVPCVRWVTPRCKVGHAKSQRCSQCPSHLVPVGFSLFHHSQTDTGTAYVEGRWAEPASDAQPIEKAERFVGSVGIRIVHSEPNRAFYSPRGDFVNVPTLDQYEQSEHYYSTVAHELVHATGHRSRCARVGITDFDSFGSEQYAREELIAELGSVLLCVGVLGIDSEPRADHAQYLRSWLSVLKADPKALHRSLTKASDAVEWLCHAASIDIEHSDQTASVERSEALA